MVKDMVYNLTDRRKYSLCVELINAFSFEEYVYGQGAVAQRRNDGTSIT